MISCVEEYRNLEGIEMKNMSFKLTTKQFLAGTKDVTRRTGWANLKAGEHFSAVEKSQGLKKGEKVVYLGQCICISNTPERLDEIISKPMRWDQPNSRKGAARECEREGFPFLSAKEFVEMFCKEMICHPTTKVNRIVFTVIHKNGEVK
jgi:hypothetical protein